MILDDIAAKRKEQLKREMAKAPFADIKEKLHLQGRQRTLKKLCRKAGLRLLRKSRRLRRQKG